MARRALVSLRPARATVLLAVALVCIACASPAPRATSVRLHLDGTDRTVTTSAPTVRALCSELEIDLGPLDLIKPPLWTPLTPDLAIGVTRGYEEVDYETLPHEERLIRDEFLEPDERQILREGADGQAELRYLLLWDGAQLLERRLIERQVITEPVTAVLLEGSRGLLPTVALRGTLAYLVNGEPWMLRRDTDNKRPLARGVQADGRVFDLSHDGRYLLYSAASDTPDAANELYVIVTDVLNTRPQPLGITNVLWGSWSPDGQQLAYATFTPIAGLPGWRAGNDLHILSWPERQELFTLEPNASFVYAWYGERCIWRPDGEALACARPDSVGLLDLRTAQRRQLVEFEPDAVDETTVWLPALAFAPDGAQLAMTLPSEVTGGTVLSLLNLASGESQRVADQPVGLAFARAGQRLAVAHLVGETAALAILDLDSLRTVTVRRDALLSLPPQLAWGPEETRLIYAYAGDLYVYDVSSARIEPLTATGLASHPVWR